MLFIGLPIMSFKTIKLKIRISYKMFDELLKELCHAKFIHNSSGHFIWLPTLEPHSTAPA